VNFILLVLVPQEKTPELERKPETLWNSMSGDKSLVSVGNGKSFSIFFQL
jgi:hypothetical protein